MVTEALSVVLGKIADEFTQRCAQGERPEITEFTARYPEHAETLEQVLPLILAITTPGPSFSA